MESPDPGIEVKDLYGGRFLSHDAVLESMRPFEERLTREFHERTQLNSELAKHARQASASLLALIEQDKSAADAVVALRALAAKQRERKLEHPLPVEAVGGIFLKPFGAVVKPPFDYDWTWSAVSGSPDDNIEKADRHTGKMSLVFDTGQGGDSSSISGRAAVGIYFYPSAANGTLQVWASPAFTDLWYDACTMDSCHTDAWIGLFVQSYDLAGAPTGPIVDQQVSLWNDSSWWSGTSGQGSNSGFGLYAPPVQVDQDHQYIIWVWIGGDVSGAGWGIFSGSGAGDQLLATVGSIQWELG